MNRNFGKRVAISSDSLGELCPEPSDEVLQLLEKMEKGIIMREAIPADAINQFIEQLNTDDSWIEFAKEDLLFEASLDNENNESKKEYRELGKQITSEPQVLPPLKLQYFLDLILPDARREYMVGCLQEEYATRIVPKYGKKYADNWYRVRVAKSILEVLWSLILRITFLTWLWRGVDSLYRKHLQ